jgi:hypothetical protein
MIAFVVFFTVTREDLTQLLLALLAGALVLCVWALESSLRSGFGRKGAPATVARVPFPGTPPRLCRCCFSSAAIRGSDGTAPRYAPCWCWSW